MLTNFVGAIYMKMYGESSKSLTSFHNRLVATHHMHYGALLAAKIKDDPKLLNDTWSKMAIGTVSKGSDVVSKSDEEKKNGKESVSSMNWLWSVDLD